MGWPESWYGLVTGFLERGEEPEAAALRELHEELGLEGRVVAPIGVYTFPERNELILAYHIEARGEVRLGTELAGFKRIRGRRSCGPGRSAQGTPCATGWPGARSA